MLEIFKSWKKEKDQNQLKIDINQKIKILYMNGNIEDAHSIFNSEWKSYIDLSYDNGSILEFAGLIKEYKEKGKALKEIKFLIDFIEHNVKNDITNINLIQDKKEFLETKYHNSIHNILLTAINFNKKDIILYITKEQSLVEIDFTYSECALITNCFPKNNSQIKKEIFNYLIMECNLRRTPEIESVLKKLKKEEILEVFDKIELYSKISNNLNDEKLKTKKLKI